MVSFALTIFVLSAVLCLTSAQQYDSYKIYDIIAGGGTMQLGGDGFGSRTITAAVVDVHACDDWTPHPTGTQTDGTSGLTTVSMFGPTAPGQTDYDPSGAVYNGDCRINNSSAGGQTSHWWPIRSIKLTAPGWKIMPSFSVTDIDMQCEGASDATDPDLCLRKGVIVFGFNGDTLVFPQWNLGGNTLVTHDMKVETNAMVGMGFTRASGSKDYIPGIMTTWGDRVPQVPVLSCAQGAEDLKCGGIVSFDTPVDGVIVAAAMEWKSTTLGGALVSIGDFKIPQGCRCSESDGVEPRRITEESATANECEVRTEAAKHYFCNPSGDAWCDRYTYTRWTITGPMDPATGRYPCTSNQAVGGRFLFPVDVNTI